MRIIKKHLLHLAFVENFQFMPQRVYIIRQTENLLSPFLLIIKSLF